MRTQLTRGSRTTTARGRRPAVLAAAAAAVALTLSACGSLGGGGSADAGSGDGGGDGDADAPLLQIDRRGGFMLPGFDFQRVPELTLYPDGRAIIHGPQIEIWPGPALPNLLVVQLSDDQVEDLLDLARDAGLLADAPDYGQPPVADVPTTFVTFVVDGETYVHQVEALGVGDGLYESGDEDLVGAEPGDDGTDEAPVDPMPPAVTEDQLAARAALADFITAAHDRVGSVGDEEFYEIEAFVIQARMAGDEALQPIDGELERQRLPWPVDVALADADACTLLLGDTAATLRGELERANQLTLWEQTDTVYEVWVRPLLPHEEGCTE
jgi:hypothetical protein